MSQKKPDKQGWNFIYYKVNWLVQGDQQTYFEERKFFSKRNAVKFATKIKGRVRKVILYVIHSSSIPLALHELPDEAFGQDGNILI